MFQAVPSFCRRTRRKQSGFTLIELMVVVGLVAILTGLAAPSFIETFRRYRVDAVREEMNATFTLARINAIRQGQPVVVRRVTGCGVVLVNTQDWSCGWQMFTDLNANNTRDTATEPLLQQVTVPTQVRVNKAVAANAQFIAFNRLGHVAQAGQQFSIFPEGQAAVNGQLLCFTTGTRIRVIKQAATCPA